MLNWINKQSSKFNKLQTSKRQPCKCYLQATNPLGITLPFSDFYKHIWKHDTDQLSILKLWYHIFIFHQPVKHPLCAKQIKIGHHVHVPYALQNKLSFGMCMLDWKTEREQNQSKKYPRDHFDYFKNYIHIRKLVFLNNLNIVLMRSNFSISAIEERATYLTDRFKEHMRGTVVCT